MTSDADRSGSTVDYHALVQNERVHGSLYTDPEVFAEEMTRIFVDGWAFVGPESEIPEHGDWVSRRLGFEQVLLTRGRDEEINVVANRCSHRGTRLCPGSEGTGRTLRCPYHGWTFGIDGALLGVSGPKGFDKSRTDLGLGRPAAVETYQGFVFANISGTAGPLSDHLGAGGMTLIDRAVQFLLAESAGLPKSIAAACTTAAKKDKRVLVHWKDASDAVPMDASLRKGVEMGDFLSNEYEVLGLVRSQHPELAEAHGASGSGSTLVVLDGGGSVLGRMAGADDLTALQQFLKTHQVPVKDAEALWNNALAEAKRTKRNILVHLGAPW